jgi:hypothetical protein
MMVIVEKLVEWRLAGETEVLGENLPQRHFVHHKSHMTRPLARTRTAAVGSQRLTAWAMARPRHFVLDEVQYNFSAKEKHFCNTKTPESWGEIVEICLANCSL